MPTYSFFTHDRFTAMLLMLSLMDEAQDCAIAPVGPCQLFGHVAMIERWLCAYHDDGDMTGIEPRRIEIAAGWCPPEVPMARAGQLYQVLCESGLIYDDNGRTRFRGWPECAPYYVREALRKRAKRGQRAAQMGASVRKCPDTCAELRLSRVELSRGEKSKEGTVPPSEGRFSSVSGSTSKKVRAHFQVARAASVGGNGKGVDADERADAADTAADADAAGAAKKRRGAAAKAYSLIAAKYSDTQWAALPPAWKATELLALMGCDESFRTTVAQKAQRDGRVADALLKLLVKFVARRKAIDNPGGWCRAALASEGIAV